MSATNITGLVYLAIKWTIAGVYLVAGIGKLLDPKSFVTLIESYGLVPEAWLLTFAIVLPLAEILAAIGLIFGARWSFHLMAGFTVLFIAILSYGIWLGLDIDCGCFGVGDPEFEVYSGLRPALHKNLFLLLGIAYLYCYRYWKPNLFQKGVKQTAAKTV